MKVIFTALAATVFAMASVSAANAGFLVPIIATSFAIELSATAIAVVSFAVNAALACGGTFACTKKDGQ